MKFWLHCYFDINYMRKYVFILPLKCQISHIKWIDTKNSMNQCIRKHENSGNPVFIYLLQYCPIIIAQLKYFFQNLFRPKKIYVKNAFFLIFWQPYFK